VTRQILLTNDDGIGSWGMTVLRHALAGLGDLTVIAPDRNTSAVARGITTGRALRLTRTTFDDGLHGLACDGTPSDCVRVGLLGVEAPEPDLVVSGVNLGANVGADVTYSGTVGAALEAALRGKPALAFSVEALEPRWLEQAEPVVRAIVDHAVGQGLARRTILNVNLPDRPLAGIAGVRPARLGGASCHDRVVLDGRDGARPDGGPATREYPLPCEASSTEDWADTDIELLALGFVTITPMHYDLLDAAMLARLSSWSLDLDGIRAGRV